MMHATCATGSPAGWKSFVFRRHKGDTMKRFSALGLALKSAPAFAALLVLSLAPSAQARHTHHSHRARHVAARPAAPVSQGVKVWVNTNSGVYHFPGERWYGNTKEGEYMSEDAAKKAGYRATENGQ